MRQFPHRPTFFIDRIQIIFALLLLCVVFIIAFVSLQSSRTVTPEVPSTPSASQAPQEVTPSSLKTQANRAITLVANLKEVQSAKSAATADNTKFVTEVDSYPTVQNNFYVIHAYEIVPDGNGNAHTATVGWYRVNPQTGTVTNSDSSPPN